MMVKKKNNNRKKVRRMWGFFSLRFFFFVISFFFFFHYFHYGFGSSLGAFTVRHTIRCVSDVIWTCFVLCACSRYCLPFASATNIISFCCAVLKNELSKMLFWALLHVTDTHTLTLTYIVIWISFRRRFDGFSSFLFDFWRFCERLLPSPPPPLLLLLYGASHRCMIWFERVFVADLPSCEREHPRTSELIFFYV